MRSLLVSAVCWAWLSPPPALSQEQPPPTAKDEASPPVALHQVVVVTPCRDCSTRLINSPAAVSVIPAERIATAPDRSFGELLRAVPGLQVVRTSVRDYNLTSRQPVSTLTNSQLVLLDGRPVYLDFLGIVLWDLVSADPGDVQQIEVVRGPASAVWGANAFTGVVNIITKSPRADQGSSVTLTAGSFDRDAGSTKGEGLGLSYGFDASLARAFGPRLAGRASVGYLTSDPFPRPVGRLPLVPHPLVPETLVGGGELPADRPGLGSFQNRGSTQPRADLRLDQQVGTGRISYSAGIAGSDGIVHTAIGPFALESGSYLGYGRVAYTRGQFSLGVFVNGFGAKAANLLLLDAAGQPVRLDVHTQTYDVSAGYSRPIGGKHVLTFGGNARHNVFDIALAPNARNRTELGAYAQEEFFFGGEEGRSQWRLAVGARLDRFGNLGHLVFSPRLAAIWKPSADHSVRFSMNRAFRSPSAVNNYLDQYFLTPVSIPGLDRPFALASRAIGDPDLKEESLTAWEIGYIGTLGGRTTLGANLYLNDRRVNIDFARLPNDYDPYTEADPPPGWPLPPSYLAELARQGIYLPRTTSQFRNLGPIRQKGMEAFVEHRFGDGISGYVNYSWQPEPRPLSDPHPFPALELRMAPRHQVSGGLYWTGRRVMGSLGFSYADRAFWVDVLAHDFDGESPAYTIFNASLGLRWADGRVVTTLRGTNLTNADVQQHDFGDILKRALWAEARFSF